MKLWQVTQEGKQPADFNFLLFMTAEQVKASLIQFSGYNESCVVAEAV